MVVPKSSALGPAISSAIQRRTHVETASSFGTTGVAGAMGRGPQPRRILIHTRVTRSEVREMINPAIKPEESTISSDRRGAHVRRRQAR